MAAASTDAIHVAVRVRAFPNQDEAEVKEKTQWKWKNNEVKEETTKDKEQLYYGFFMRTQIWPDSEPSRRFLLGHVLPPECSNEDLYSALVRPMVDKVTGGYHSTVFAYGQSGAGERKTTTLSLAVVTCLHFPGKTHTMLGTNSDPGVIGRAVEQIYGTIDAEGQDQEKKVFIVKVSYIEIYNETLIDLLQEVSDEKALFCRFPS